jgi:hypothetical protein
MSRLTAGGPALPSLPPVFALSKHVPVFGNLSGCLTRPQVHRCARPLLRAGAQACGLCGRDAQAVGSLGGRHRVGMGPGRSLGVVTREGDTRGARRSPRGVTSVARAQCAPVSGFLP